MEPDQEAARALDSLLNWQKLSESIVTSRKNSSTRLPNPGRGEFDHVTIRITEVKTACAAFPTYLTQKIDIMLRQSRSPEIYRVLRNAERDVSRTSTVLLRQRTRRQDITARCLVRCSRGFAAD